MGLSFAPFSSELSLLLLGVLFGLLLVALLLGMENQRGVSSSKIRKLSSGSGGGGAFMGERDFLELTNTNIDWINHSFSTPTLLCIHILVIFIFQREGSLVTTY